MRGSQSGAMQLLNRENPVTTVAWAIMMSPLRGLGRQSQTLFASVMMRDAKYQYLLGFFAGSSQTGALEMEISNLISRLRPGYRAAADRPGPSDGKFRK